MIIGRSPYVWPNGSETALAAFFGANVGLGFYRVAVDQLGIRAIDGLTIGIAAGAPAPDNVDQVLIWKGTAGAVAADADSLLVLENAGRANLQFLAPNNAIKSILFGEVLSALRGAIHYFGSAHATPDRLRFDIADAAYLFMEATTFAFQQATTMSTSTGALTISPTTDLVVTRPLQVSSGQLMRFGTSSFSTPGTNNLVLLEGTAPSGTLTDGGAFYVRDAAGTTEATYVDSAGGVTNLS